MVGTGAGTVAVASARRNAVERMSILILINVGAYLYVLNQLMDVLGHADGARLIAGANARTPVHIHKPKILKHALVQDVPLFSNALGLMYGTPILVHANAPQAIINVRAPKSGTPTPADATTAPCSHVNLIKYGTSMRAGASIDALLRKFALHLMCGAGLPAVVSI